MALDDTSPQMSRQLELPFARPGEALHVERSEEVSAAGHDSKDPGTSGLMEREGTPQGGPLSPLLANVLLGDVDKELEKRGHAFVRYADDSRVFVASRRAGERVMEHLRRLYGCLRLVINEDKSAIAPFWERPFLGYSMYAGTKVDVGLRPSPKSVARLRALVRGATGRVVGKSMAQVVAWLAPRLRGWGSYFRLTTQASALLELDGWVRRRLRALLLKQWRQATTIRRNLRNLGATEKQIMRVTAVVGRWWSAAGSACHAVLTTRYFDELGVPRLAS